MNQQVPLWKGGPGGRPVAGGPFRTVWFGTQTQWKVLLVFIKPVILGASLRLDHGKALEGPFLAFKPARIGPET